MLLGERANPRRSFLLVSTVLGKHIPLSAKLCRLAGVALALRGAGDERAPVAIRTLLHGDRADAAAALDEVHMEPARIPGPVTVIGFAETATGLAHQVAEGLDADWLQCTTRHPEAAGSMDFAETHSHAPDQWLMDVPAEHRSGTLMLVDDELSTGKTAAALLERLAAVGSFERIVVACLVDSRPAGDGPLDALGARLGLDIPVVSLSRIEPVDAPPAGWSGGRLPEPGAELAEPDMRDVVVDYDGPLERHGMDREGRSAFSDAVGTALHGLGDLDYDTLMIGCGEHLAFGQLAASDQDLLTTSSTRSPALVSTAAGYPLVDGLTFAHPEDPSVPGYAYNVAPATRSHVVVHFSEPAHRAAAGGLLGALAAGGATRITTVTLAR